MPNTQESPAAGNAALERRYGFNFLWLFSNRPDTGPEPPDLAALDLMAYYCLDFARIPANYQVWTRDFQYDQPDPGILEVLDGYLDACRARSIHMCFNLHRAPGYCIGGKRDLERHNLWTDQEAQDGFVFQWDWFARHFKGVPAEQLSFNLVNEPHHPGGDFGITRENHEKIMRRAVKAIRAADPCRPIVLDGLAGGDWPMPELADLTNTTQSTRGYQPHALSQYKAPWYPVGTEDPVWPGVEWAGKRWDRQTLADHYGPWRELEHAGVPVHVGEFGCYNTAANEVALAWFRDLFTLFREYRWGYALWNFKGPFGIVEHGRPGARLEKHHGFLIDRDLLELFLEGRAT